MPTILLLGTFDTKLTELLHLHSQITRANPTTHTILLDVGRTPTTHPAITIPQPHLATTYAPDPQNPKDPSTLPRVEVIKYMTACACNYIREHLRRAEPLHGIIGAGGSGGTSLAAAVMREALPTGFPKLIVSTIASGDTRAVVGETDVTLMYSVVDVAGLNWVLRRVLGSAAGAIVGMAEAYERGLREEEEEGDGVGGGERKMRVGLTMFGVTTPCVTAVKKFLEEQYAVECFVFHCTGAGGRALERLIREGKIDAVLDVTTTEICDFLFGGTMSAGPQRLEAALKAGIPNVVSLGATDMVNFGTRETVPEKYRQRKLYEHNPTVTLMRTSPEECREIGEFMVGKIKDFAKERGNVEVVLPKGGVSMIAVPGAAFADKEADEAIFGAIERGLRNSGVFVIADDRPINDEAFAIDLAQRLVRKMGLEK
ncbi:hypothetical protein MBLNU230_g0353t1 [Neophaeotheca triangularis]